MDLYTIDRQTAGETDKPTDNHTEPNKQILGKQAYSHLKKTDRRTEMQILGGMYINHR